MPGWRALRLLAFVVAMMVMQLSSGGCRGETQAEGPPAATLANEALGDLLKFWVGDINSGRLKQDIIEDKREVGVWEQAQAIMAFYWAWKYLGNKRAGQLVAAEWNWTKQHAGAAADLATCSRGAQFNFASDDTGWDVGFYLAANEVTNDPAALTAAKASLDCAWRMWWDPALGGGYWYNDQHADKTMYQAVLTMDAQWLFRLSDDKTYLGRAVAGEQWAVDRLRRDDGLYWKAIHSNGAVPEERVRYLINPTQSVTMIVGNMAQAIAEIWLYEDTGRPEYLTLAQGTAAGILKYEVDRNGVLINDQDGYTDGWAMIPFAREVVANLVAPDRAAWANTFRRSALSVWRNDRHANGTYGADWGGPLNGGAWYRQGRTQASEISVSGGAVNVIVAAAALNGKSAISGDSK